MLKSNFEEHLEFAHFEEYVEFAKKAKTRHQLHPIAEKKLKLYLAHLYPRDYAVSEISGVVGGRNDLMQFYCNGRRTVFEFFFSPSQVSQDLRLLELAQADVKLAILLEKEVKPQLAEEYFHKKPDHFPYLWLSDLLLVDRKEDCFTWLCEQIDGYIVKRSLFVSIPPQLSAGTQVRGRYKLKGKFPTKAPITKEQMEIIQEIQSESNGSVPLSFSIDTADGSSSTEVAGNITAQY